MVEFTFGGVTLTDWITAGAAIVAAVGTIVIAFGAWVQLGHLRRDAKSAEADRKEQIDKLQAQVTATQKAADDSLRPLVVVDNQALTIARDLRPVTLTLSVFNVGPGPAVNVLFDAWLFPRDDEPSDGEKMPGGDARLMDEASATAPHFAQVFAGMPAAMRESRPYSLPATEHAPALWTGAAGTFLVVRIAYQNIFREDAEPVGHVHWLTLDELRIGSSFLPAPPA